MSITNAILVYAENGFPTHCFLPASEARARLEKIAAAGEGGSMFETELVDAEMCYQVSPQLRSRVDGAKSKLRGDLRILQALDRAEIPADIALRRKICAVIQALQSPSV